MQSASGRGYPSGSMMIPFMMPLAGVFTPVVNSPISSDAMPIGIIFY